MTLIEHRQTDSRKPILLISNRISHFRDLHAKGIRGKNRKEMKRAIERIENLTIKVTDLKRAVSFYGDVLGLKKRDEWSNYATFNIGDMMLGLDPDPKGELAIFMHVANVDEEYKTLKEKGVKFLTEPKDQYWGGRTAKFADPDGNKFIIVSYKE